MAEENVVNGVDHRSKIEALERERDELATESADRKEQIKKLTLEIEGLRRDGAEVREKLEAMVDEVEKSREARKAAEVIAARAADLETEVARLQHDALEDAELRKLLAEKESRADSMERELELLKRTKSESEVKIRDLERKIGNLEIKEVEERSKRIRVEEELRDKILEKEKEISGLGKKVKELESFGDSKKSELEDLLKEKLSLEGALRESEERARVLESSVDQLRNEANEAKNAIKSLKEKVAGTVERGLIGNGVAVEEGKGMKGSKVQWPVVAAGSTGAVVAAAAVVYVCYGKRR